MRSVRYFFLFLISSILSGTFVIGKPITPYFYNYKSIDGLSNNTVFCSLQDSHGFIWFGTKDGLNRFDGHNFDVFRSGSAKYHGLRSNYILTLAEDKYKRLWVGTDNGIYYSNPITNSFNLLDSIFKSREIYDIEIDSDNTAWIICNGELFSYKIDQKSLQKHTSRPKFNLTVSTKDNNGNLYFGTNDGKILKFINNKIVVYCDFKNHIKANDNINIQVIKSINSNEILIGTTKYGVLKWNKKQNKYSTLFTDPETKKDFFVRDILIFNEDILWYATENGLYIHNILKNTYTNHKKSHHNKWGISDNAIYNLLKDNEQGIWVGTYFAGVNYYHPNNNHIQKIYATGESNSIQGNVVRAINQDKYGFIWIGTEDAGFSKWDKLNNQFFNYSTHTNTIGNDNVHGLIQVDDKIWISTFFNGVDIFNTDTKSTIKHIDKDANKKKGLKNNFLNFLLLSKKNEIYATSRGLYRFNKYEEDFEEVTQVPNNIIYTTICEDVNNNLWLGTYRNGLFFLNTQTGKTHQYQTSDNEKNNLPHNRINYIYQDSNNKIWIATDNGIAYLEPETTSFIKLNTADLKFGNLIYAIIEDEQKNLWISSSYGLLRYNIETGAKRVFNTETGIISMNFNYNSVFKDQEKNLYFGSTSGLISFNPISLNSIEFPKDIPLYITNFQLQDDEIRKSIGSANTNLISLPFTEKISLKHDESSFTINFAALLFQAPRSITYQYKMDGLDDHWTTMYDNRKVYFTKLTPGNYTFKVRAKDPNGNDIEQIRSLHIFIASPWYATNYAIFCYLIISIASIIIVYIYYRRKIDIKNKTAMLEIARQKDQELFQSKMDFFTEVAHEIRTPLTLIRAPLQKLRATLKPSNKEEKLLLIIQKNTDKLITLSNKILNFKKTEIANYALKFSNHDIEYIVKKIYLDFTTTFKSSRKEVIYKSDSNIIAPIDIEAFESICNNLLSNALKYSTNYIEILLTKNENKSIYCLQIKNNGPTIKGNEAKDIFEPFKRASQHKEITGSGLGLALTKSLIEKHGGNIIYYIDSNNLNTFEIILPLN
jgi:ligand-binding sensor domain-containing protein/signal transduction histidine kinase